MRPNNVLCYESTNYRLINIMCFSMTQQRLVSQGFLIIEASRSHSDTSQSAGLLWTSDQPDADTTHNTRRQTDIHVPGGIRIGNPSKRAAADPCLKSCGHWDRQFVFCGMSNFVHTTLIRHTETHTQTRGPAKSTICYVAVSFWNQM